MGLIDYVNDCQLYRTVFNGVAPTRSYAIACYFHEKRKALAWFAKNVGQTPIVVILDPEKGKGGKSKYETLTIKEFAKRPELALIVFGIAGRRKAVLLAGGGIREFAFHEDQNYTNHKFNEEMLSKFKSRLSRIFDRLADEDSRRIFASLVKHRITGDHGYLRISTYAQYKHPIVKPEPGDWIGDCGALTGNTAKSFARKVGAKGRVFAFEPDPSSYAICAERTKDRPKTDAKITVLNVGLADKPGKLTFLSNMAGASKISETGDIEVQIETLDRFAKQHKIKGPGLLSFDIEGFEYQALEGGKKMIQKMRPKLQISLYHKGSDLFRLPLWVMENLEDYQIYIGHHNSHHAESDIYAIAN